MTNLSEMLKQAQEMQDCPPRRPRPKAGKPGQGLDKAVNLDIV